MKRFLAVLCLALALPAAARPAISAPHSAQHISILSRLTSFSSWVFHLFDGGGDFPPPH